MVEDYVSFVIAKLLKEKGFDWEVHRSYLVNDNCFAPADINDLPNRKDAIRIPTLQMAMKWLREVKHIPIEILWHYDSNSDVEEWYFIHHTELRILPNDIEYYETYEKAAEAAIKYCLENLI